MVRRTRKQLIKLAREAGEASLRWARRLQITDVYDPNYRNFSSKENRDVCIRAAMRAARDEYAEAARLVLDGYFVLGGHRKEVR